MKKTSVILLLSSGLLLNACGDGEKDTVSNPKEKTENTVKPPKVKELKNSNESKKDKETSNVANLSEETKLALAFFTDNAGKYTLTKLEALNGIYQYQGLQGKEAKLAPEIVLVKKGKIPNAPENMNFYTVRPDKGNFETEIGVSDKEIFVGGTQSAIDYNELKKTGDVYSLKDVHEKNKKYTSVAELADKIKITDKDPMQDEKTRENFMTMQNPATQAHYRTQVYQKIADFEGKETNGKGVYFDDIKVTKKGWIVNFRDENGEILGKYSNGKNGVEKQLYKNS